MQIWQLDSGTCTMELAGHQSLVWAVAWHPEGRLLASGGQDACIKLWDTQTGRCINTLQGHRHLIWSVAWSPDGQTLASSSSDGTVRIWDSTTGECLQVLKTDRPYEGVNIAGAMGISEEQRSSLKALGAVES